MFSLSWEKAGRKNVSVFFWILSSMVANYFAVSLKVKFTRGGSRECPGQRTGATRVESQSPPPLPSPGLTWPPALTPYPWVLAALR